ncbi:hypothetical protein M758_4G065900 [Ceratodon purpureus]|nr:hypothetical protein M758_4G065900 [Ceratodon purpureus]
MELLYPKWSKTASSLSCRIVYHCFAFKSKKAHPCCLRNVCLEKLPSHNRIFLMYRVTIKHASVCLALDCWSALKLALEMLEFHLLHTVRNRHSSGTGRKERMRSITSNGSSYPPTLILSKLFLRV